MGNWQNLEEIRDNVFTTYNELFDKVSNMSFMEAYKEFKGFNLSADPYLDTDRETFVSNLKFDLRYKDIETTIFQCDDDECELWETAVYVLEQGQGQDKGEIVFEIAAHDCIDVYSIIVNGNVVVLKNWVEKTK